MNPAPTALWLAAVAPLAAEAESSGRGWLSASEVARLEAIQRPARRAQFLAGRLLARRLLAACFGGDALVDWSLTAPAEGAPRLAHAGSAAAPMHFSISHSGDAVVCAVADEPVGVDIETPSARRNVPALAALVCSEAEQARLAALNDVAARDHCFHEMWTLKEAWLKQRGEGASPGRMARLETCPVAGPQADAWSWRTPRGTLALMAPHLVDRPAIRWLGDDATALAALSASAWHIVDPQP